MNEYTTNGPQDEVEHDDYVPPDWPGTNSQVSINNQSISFNRRYDMNSNICGNPNTYEDHDEVATEAERILSS